MSNTPTNTSIISALTELGLAENDAILYELLLNTPEATIPVLQQKSPFSRTMLYYILNSLEEWGLVTKKEIGKKTVYQAEPPQKLEDLVRDQEKTIERGKNLLNLIIPDLTSAYRLAHNKPGVRFFEGLEGIKEVTFDSLKATGAIYTFMDTEAIDKYAKEMNKLYIKERTAKKIPKKIITVDTPFARDHYARMPISELTEVKLIPAQFAPFQTGVQIYNNTVSFSTLTEKEKIGVIIDDPNISQLHRSLFEYMWETLPCLSLNSPASTPPYSSP